MVIIGICGFQGSGKDTFSNYLVNEYGFEKLSFASVAKDVISAIFGWDRKMLEGDTNESRIFREIVDPWWSDKLSIPNFTPRKAMQFIGTDLFRDKFNDNIWIFIIERKILSKANKNIIISDCRFRNEIDMIRNLGAKIIHIKRNIPIWFETFKKTNIECDEFKKLHKSEQEWIKENFDYEIINNESIEEFKEKINIFVNKYFCK